MITEHIAIRSYARVSAKLKERIASGEFEIGARLPPERELTISYNVSRPTIREAMIALEIEGIVSVRPGSGNYVISKRSRIGLAVDTDVDVFELLQARRTMESEACAMAALRICPEQLIRLANTVKEIRKCQLNNDVGGFEYAERQFHISIAEASGQAVAAAIYTLWSIRAFASQNEILNSKLRAFGQNQDFKNYDNILQALTKRDVEGARATMWDYYTPIIESIMNDFESEEMNSARARVKEKKDLYLK